MMARVLAALLFTEQPTITAGELGDQLQASSGAISGAINTLTSVGLVEKVPVPTSRRDHYRLRDDAWAIQYTNQNQVTSAVLEAAEAGIAAADAAAWPTNVSPKCAISTTFCSRRFQHCWIAGTRRP